MVARAVSKTALSHNVQNYTTKSRFKRMKNQHFSRNPEISTKRLETPTSTNATDVSNFICRQKLHHKTVNAKRHPSRRFHIAKHSKKFLVYRII